MEMGGLQEKPSSVNLRRLLGCWGQMTRKHKLVHFKEVPMAEGSLCPFLQVKHESESLKRSGRIANGI
jgi:hypothetical protein